MSIVRFILRGGDLPLEAAFGNFGHSVSVVGGTVYYSSTPAVSPTVNDGSIASGSSTTLYGNRYLVVAASTSRVDVTGVAQAVPELDAVGLLNPVAFAGADPTGTTDSTQAVLTTAVAQGSTLAAPTVRLGPGTFKLNLLALDRIYLEGAGSDLTTIVPASLTSPIIQVGGASGIRDQRAYIDKVKITSGGVDRSYAYPLIHVMSTRNLIFGTDVYFDTEFNLALCVKLESAYQNRWWGTHFRTGKFGMPVEWSNTHGFTTDVRATGAVTGTVTGSSRVPVSTLTGTWVNAVEFICDGVPSGTVVTDVTGSTLTLSRRVTIASGASCSGRRVPQCDTFYFNMQVDGASGGIFRNGYNDVHGLNFFGKVVQSSYMTAASQSTTCTTTAAAGDTSIVVASASGIVASDLLYLDPGRDNAEQVRVSSSYVSGTTIALDPLTPLRFDHARSFAFTASTNTSTSLTSVPAIEFTEILVGMQITGTGIPASTTITAVSSATTSLTLSNAATASASITATAQDVCEVYRGGVGISIADGWTGVKFPEFHFEAQQLGTALGNVRNVIFDGPYVGCGRLIQVVGDAQQIQVNKPEMLGTASLNELLRRKTNSSGVNDGQWECLDPYVPAGAHSTPVVPDDYFPHTTRNWSIRTNKNGVMMTIHNAGSATSGTAAVEQTRLDNAPRSQRTYGGAILGGRLNGQSAAVTVNTLVVANKTSYQADPNYIPVDTTSGVVTITLPAANTVPPGAIYVIGDEGGNAAVNNITIARSSTDNLFDSAGSATSKTIATAYQQQAWRSNSVSKWFRVW